MEQILDELYTQLVESVVNMIPTKWKELYFLGEVEEDKKSWSFIFYFKNRWGKWIRSEDICDKYRVKEEIYDELEEKVDEVLFLLYDCFVENKQEPWKYVTFSFNSQDEFSIEYIYDEFEGGPVAMEVNWAYNTFSYIPQSNYLKGLIKHIDGQ